MDILKLKEDSSATKSKSQSGSSINEEKNPIITSSRAWMAGFSTYNQENNDIRFFIELLEPY